MLHVIVTNVLKKRGGCRFACKTNWILRRPFEKGWYGAFKAGRFIEISKRFVGQLSEYHELDNQIAVKIII